MEKTRSQRKMGKLFERVVRKLFSTPSINLIGSYEGGQSGVWKTGKTDFFLLISEILLDLGVVEEVATNIDTKGHYDYVHDLETTKYWLHRNNKVKLFGLDEANIHLPSRRAMSNKSVDIIQIFPEISKARARLVVIGQKLSSLDSELRGAGWVKGIFQKVDLKTVYITSPFFETSYTFREIPPTSITFDPYLQAPFTMKPEAEQTFEDEDLRILWRWANGESWNEIGLGKHPETVRRRLHETMKQILTTYSQLTHISGGGVSSVKVSNPTNNDIK